MARLTPRGSRVRVSEADEVIFREEVNDGTSQLSGRAMKYGMNGNLYQPIRENGHSLKTWGYRVNFTKQEQPIDFDEYTPQMLEYCCNDVRLNELVYFALLREQTGFSEESIALEHRVASIISDQENNGFKFDERQATTLLADLKAKMYEVTSEVQRTFKPKMTDVKLVTPKIKKDGELSKSGLTAEEYERLIKSGSRKPFMRQELKPFNLGSRKQICEYLIDFGWKPNRFTPTCQPIVDEGTLKKITHIHEAKLIADFLLYQKRIAQIQSWLDAVEDDGRVHGYVNSNGAVTGRMTHSSPNMAQVPSSNAPYGKDCRACWTSPKGYKVVGMDASGLELRMLAHYMNDEAYTNEILTGDIHTANQLASGVDTRSQAKTFIYAFLYGAGDAKIGSIVGGTARDGKRLKEKFLTNTPSLRDLRERVSVASRRGYVRGLDGRRVTVRSEHAALNTLLQSAGAIVMKKALCLLDEYATLWGLDYKFVGNIHDEIQTEVKEDEVDTFGRLAVSCMEAAGQHFNLNCPLAGEYQIGDNWSETH